MTTTDVVRRIRAEYLEMPGLKLSRAQAQRLWGLDEHLCAEILELLADAKFLRRTSDGFYARLFDGAINSSRDDREQRTL
jgi:hypothetical protein